jgi:NADH-ubiquinone oxidoreductase chain 2
LLSLIIGSILGLAQSRIKRLYAYSTINHLGFILLALSINSLESIQAFMFYLIQYSMSNLGAFIILISIGYVLINHVSNNDQIKSLKDRNNSPIQLISQLRGLFSINPLLGISLSITIFSFLGVPPLMGFFGKQMVLSASLDKGYVFMSLIGILTSVIGGVYYLAINKNIFFDNSVYTSEDNVIENKSLTSLSSPITIVVSIITILIMTFMFIPDINFYLFNLITIGSIF